MSVTSIVIVCIIECLIGFIIGMGVGYLWGRQTGWSRGYRAVENEAIEHGFARQDFKCGFVWNTHLFLVKYKYKKK